MKLTSSLFSGSRWASSARDPADDYWYRDIGGRTASGMVVTPDSALRASVIYACVSVISQDVAKLPLKLFFRSADGDKTAAERHPLYRVLHDEPNEEQTSYEFRLQQQWNLCLRGNAYAEILAGRNGPISQLVPINPDHVALIRVNGALNYVVAVPGEPRRVLGLGEMWHLKGSALSANGCTALCPISVEAQAIGAALATQDYAARFFANDARPGLLFKHPGSFKDNESRDNFLAAWQRQQTGPNRHRAAVLEFGMEVADIGMTNEQIQFLETRKYQDNELARIFRMPPHKVGILEHATFTNIEQQSIEYVVDTLQPWLVGWEQSIKKHLVIGGDLFAEFNVNGLLRGDIESRYRAYATGRNWGWLSANDVRRAENMNSLGPDGDHYLTPTNMGIADQLSPGRPSGQSRAENQRPAIDPESANPPPKRNGTNRGALQ